MQRVRVDPHLLYTIMYNDVHDVCVGLLLCVMFHLTFLQCVSDVLVWVSSSQDEERRLHGHSLPQASRALGEDRGVSAA